MNQIKCGPPLFVGAQVHSVGRGSIKLVIASERIATSAGPHQASEPFDCKRTHLNVIDDGHRHDAHLTRLAFHRTPCPGAHCTKPSIPTSDGGDDDHYHG